MSNEENPKQEDFLNNHEGQESEASQTEEQVDVVNSEVVVEQNDTGNSELDSEGSAIEQLAAAHEQIAKLKDSFLRAKAEQDNIRRRSEKEVANSRKFAVEGFAKELLQVRDSLKLAADVDVPAESDNSIKSIHEGVNITLKQLDSVFEKFSLQEIMPQVGDKLDPNLHQAMSIVDSEDVQSGHILTVIQQGFQLNERLLRPAMVVVAK